MTSSPEHLYHADSSAATLAVAAAVLAAASGASYALYRHLLPKPLPDIPYFPEGARSILGDFPAMMREGGTAPIDWLITRAGSLPGPLSQIFILPLGKPVLLLTDYHESNDVMMRRGAEWDRSDWSIAFLGGILPKHQINFKTGAEWKSHRRLLQDLMGPAFLHSVAAPNIYRSAERLVELWRIKADASTASAAADGAPVPFSAEQDVFYSALDAVLDFGFGDSFEHRAVEPQLRHLKSLVGGSDGGAAGAREVAVNGQRTLEFDGADVDETVVALFKTAEAIQEVGDMGVPSLAWAWYNMKPSSRRSNKVRERFSREQVERAVRKMTQGNIGGGGGKERDKIRSAVDLMVDRERKFAEKDGREPVYWSQAMHDEIIGFVIAGHDTTSTTITWGLKLLADHPEAQTRLRQHLRAAFPAALAEKRMPTHDEIVKASIPYLDGTMEEILRLGGTTTFLERQSTEDTALLGHHVPKGTLLIMAQRGPSITTPARHIDPAARSETSRAAAKERGLRHWDDADVGLFRPERWITTGDGDGEGDGREAYDAQAGPMLSFGSGLRGCFGRKLAYVELKLLTTLIVWSFELERCPEALSGYERVEGLTQKPKDCYVALKKVVY